MARSAQAVDVLLEKAREVALQYHLDHSENHRVIVVSIETMDVWSVSHEDLYRLEVPSSDGTKTIISPKLRTRLLLRSVGRQIPVLIISKSASPQITNMAHRRLTPEERYRFAIGLLNSSLGRAASEGKLYDFYSVSLRKNIARLSSHRVVDSDLAGEHRREVERLVAQGKLPVIVEVGRMKKLLVLDRPASSVP